MKEDKNLKEDLEETDETSAVKKESVLKDFGCAIAMILILSLVILGIFAFRAYRDSSKESGDSNTTNIVDQIIYRDLQNGDFTISDNNGDFTTKVVITIQANTDIKEFSASVYLYDEDKNVIDSQNVSYNNMSSGSRYEVVFNLSLSESWHLDSYQVKNIRGKVKK